MKCLILGDIHLGKGISCGRPAELGSLNSRIQDQIDILDWAYDLCIKDNINNIIIAGDVYQDFRPHPTLINLFMLWLNKCKKSTITVDIIMGNHDIIRSGQWVSSALDLVNNMELENSVFYKEFSRIELEDFTIILAPFRDKRMYDVKTKEEAFNCLKKEFKIVCKQKSNKIKVCIGHFAIEGSLSVGDEIADQLNELYVSPDMFYWFDYVWMGHIHNPQVIQYENPYLAHIGSLDRSDFSKTEVNINKIAILLDSELENKFTEITIPIRPLRPVNIDIPTGKDSTEFVINELCLLSKKLQFKNAIVKLDIKLNGSDLGNVDRNKIETYLYNNLGIFHICGFSESRTVSIIQINPEDCFDNSMSINDSINKWANTKFTDKNQKEEFKKFAYEIIKEYEEKMQK
jgi:DNA repair exonuclease SbcCD nuclease subunit